MIKMATPSSLMIKYHYICSFARYLTKRSYTVIAPERLGGKLPGKFRKEEKLPDETDTLAHRLAAQQSSSLNEEVIDIGKPYKLNLNSIRRNRYKRALQNRSNKELEREARLHQLKIPLDKVSSSYSQEWEPIHRKNLAEHYGIYRDLFNGATFIPSSNATIAFDYDDEYVTPVHRGNIILPSEARTQPSVELSDTHEDCLYSLIMTTPDGHFKNVNSEYLHWAVVNFPRNDISKGQLLCNYLQPFPPKGLGYFRYVFILYQQKGSIDFGQEQRPTECWDLEQRSFQNVEFFKKFQHSLVPVGLSWFQSTWDSSVKDIFHNKLDMPQPVYEYDHPPHYVAPPVRYPHKEPFNRYYDRYRHKKDLAEEALKMKLKMINPFKEYPPRLKYPLADRPKGYRPSWLKKREELIALRKEHFKDLP